MKYFSLRNLALAAFALCLIYTVTGFFILPFAAEKTIVKLVDTRLNRHAEVQGIRFNPYTFKARVIELKISDKAGRHVLSAPSISIDLSAASLVKLAPVISGVEIDQPAVSLVLNPDNRLSIDDILASSPAGNVADQNQTPPRFSIAGVRITEGRIEFSDRVRNRSHRIDHLNLDLPLVSSLPEDNAERTVADLSMALNNAGIQARVDSRPFDPAMDTTFSLKAGDIDLADYLAYLPVPEGLNLASPGQAALDVSGHFIRDAGGDKLSLDAAFTLVGLDIRSPKGPLFSCPELRLKAAAQDLMSKQVTITEAVISGSQIHLGRNAQGEIDLMNLFAKPDTAGPQSHPAGQEDSPLPFRIKVQRGGFENATLVFRDESLAPSFETRLSNLDAIVKDLDVGKGGISGDYLLGFETESEAQLSSTGKFSMAAGPALSGRIEINGVRPEKYRPYYLPFAGDQVNLGRTDISAAFTAEKKEDALLLQVSEGRIFLEDFRLADPGSGESLIDLKRIQLTDIAMDLGQKQLDLGRLETEDGRIRIARLTTGELDLVNAVESIAGASPSAGQNDGEDSRKVDRPWTLSLDRLSLKGYQVKISDLMQRKPVQLKVSDIKIDAENIKPDQKGKISASMRLEDRGRIGLSGTLELSDLAGAFDLDLSEIAVKSFEPYFTDYLKILITKGQLASKGRVVFSLPENESPRVRFKGEASLTDFEIRHKGTDMDFFRYKSLYLSGIDVSPTKVDISEVSLTDFYHRLVLSKEGRFSLNEILAEDTGEKTRSNRTKDPLTKDPTTRDPMEVNIGTITLQGGHIHFSDYFTTPNFTANMTELAGSIKGLSTRGGAPAELQLKGVHGRHSPLDISGIVDPFKQDPYFDVTVSFKNIGLPEFNAYAVKYLGYEIERGKLVLDLKYKIQGRALASNNRLFFDHLTLGKRVESEDATSLPIKLAISLLTNSKGEIDLDLPINGNLDDPQFNYGDVLGTTFRNFILSVVTAPFKFLGGLAGIVGGEDLGYVEFAPGSELIDEANESKIQQLTDILTEKENLKIQIEGRYDPATDREQLIKDKYEALLVSMMPEGDRDKNIDSLDPEVRNALVAAAYAAAEFPKPRDASGLEKEISIEEKEKLLLTSMVVDEKELEGIAKRRSEQIREQMISRGNIDPARIFIHDPDPVSDKDRSNDKVKTWFRLK